MKLLMIVALLAIGLANLNDAKTIAEETHDENQVQAAPTTAISVTDNVLEVARSLGCKRFYSMANSSSTKNILITKSDFTLFAPTDLALRNFDDSALARISSDPALLHSFVGFHAAFGRVMSKDVTNDKTLLTLAGYSIRMNVYTVNEKAYVTASGAPVAKVDNAATNGVVHVVDAVLYPPPRANIMQTLSVGQEFGLIYSLVIRSGIKDIYEAEGPYTFFAPTDVAIEKLLPDEIIILIENPEILDEFLKLQTVAGTFHTPGLINNTLTNLSNKKIITEVGGDSGSGPTGIFVNGALINRASTYPVTNGVIHGIDSVMASPADLLKILAHKRSRQSTLH